MAPTVRVGVPPATVSTAPAPLKLLIDSEKVFRSSVPSTATLPLPLPSGITFAAPSFKVLVELTVVLPE